MASGLPRSGDATADASYASFRPDPPGTSTRTATVRSISPGLRPAAVQALSTVARSGATPVGRFPVCRYQAFQALTYGTVISSILWPVDPTSSGGPPGRGRGKSSQSRAV